MRAGHSTRPAAVPRGVCTGPGAAAACVTPKAATAAATAGASAGAGAGTGAAVAEMETAASAGATLPRKHNAAYRASAHIHHVPA